MDKGKISRQASWAKEHACENYKRYMIYDTAHKVLV